MGAGMKQLLYRKRCICGSSNLMDAWYREDNGIGVVCMTCGHAGPVEDLPESKLYSYTSANLARSAWNATIASKQKILVVRE